MDVGTLVLYSALASGPGGPDVDDHRRRPRSPHPPPWHASTAPLGHLLWVYFVEVDGVPPDDQTAALES